MVLQARAAASMFVVHPRETFLLRGDVRTLMNISLLAAPPLSALAFVLRANPSKREENLARHLPQVIIEVPAMQRPPSTLLRKPFSGLTNKSQQLRATLATTKAMWVMESGGGMKVFRDQLSELM